MPLINDKKIREYSEFDSPFNVILNLEQYKRSNMIIDYKIDRNITNGVNKYNTYINLYPPNENIIENYQEYCDCCGEKWEMFESEDKIFSSTDLDRLISLCYTMSYSKPEYLYIFKMNGDIIRKVIK